MHQDAVSAVDHRRIQRIAARREGRPVFWLQIGGNRLPLDDLSLEGFGITGAGQYRPGMAVSFILLRDDDAALVRGEGEVANQFGGCGGRTGFHIRAMAEEDRKRLHAWLAAHVIACASVPISEEDAAALVSGPSII